MNLEAFHGPPDSVDDLHFPHRNPQIMLFFVLYKEFRISDVPNVGY